jgi:hypothetical protein
VISSMYPGSVKEARSEKPRRRKVLSNDDRAARRK